ncbi:type II toxin-antitoxin system PemK/MazF family toxin [Pseudobutyrivibrio sp.]|jgi:mRNA-degrading endonuclease toxin of MazEF toxin-antitoxin module|uniref:type II toxin-antitoxin system PemK/MazF family toxin n=1 Tax=Pseudobutyrivibrio sp. TaxID=2014367 RepID=UPI0025EC56C2|nr:type II toxin-antitoxin system PemK/MazF family toxin [Pseudobutyrivibrio sp.]
MVEQGDIIQIENINDLALVISKNQYNESEKAIICPILKNSIGSTFEIEFLFNEQSYYVICDNVKQIDLRPRFYSKKGTIPLNKLMFVTDMLQAIIDYV